MISAEASAGDAAFYKGPALRINAYGHVLSSTKRASGVPARGAFCCLYSMASQAPFRTETEGSDRHGDTMFDGDVLRAVAVDIIVRAGASVGRIAQGNAARIQSEMYAASGLQI
jgi:hypothetical protein